MHLKSNYKVVSYIVNISMLFMLLLLYIIDLNSLDKN